MALLEGPPVIAEDLLEGVFVDSLSVVCHGRWLYHTLPPGSPACPHCPVPLPGLWREENRGSTKRKFLYAQVTSEPWTVAADLQPGARDRRRTASPALVSEHAPVG